MATDRGVYRLTADGGVVVATEVHVAHSIWGRTKGLMMRRGLAAGEGLAIRPCNSIHMFFMRFAIDVAFVDASGKVLHVCHSIRPWRVSKMVRHSKAAIELEAGALKRAGVAAGSVLTMAPVVGGDPAHS